MEIQHKDGVNRGRFFIENKGEKVAAIEYTRKDNTIVIDHTEVEPSLRGKNVGYELVNRTVEYAREKGLKVSPICPFALKQFEKNPAWKDLLV